MAAAQHNVALRIYFKRSELLNCVVNGVITEWKAQLVGTLAARLNDCHETFDCISIRHV